MSNRKQVINIEEEALDKVEHFMAKNLRKMLAGIVALLVLFVVGYTFVKMNKSKNAMLANNVGTLELGTMTATGSPDKIKSFADAAATYSKGADYIKLRAAELYVDAKDIKDAQDVLKSTDGDMKELSDGLKYDTGDKSVDPKSYVGKGVMGSVWYYRACLKATGAEKNTLMSEFKKNYPDSELLKQLERWNG